MLLHIDSNILVDLLRSRQPAYYAAMDQARAGGSDIRISSVCLHELLYGAMRSDRPDRQLEMVSGLVEAIEVEPWTAEDALVAARLRAQLRSLGQPIGAYDTLIAAHAIRRNAVLVTRNLRDFFRLGTLLDELPLIDWTISDQPLDRATLVAHIRRPLED